jgi:hypothetical protein
MAFDFSFASGGSSFSYSNRPFYDFFSFGSFEEVVLFLAVLLIGFAVSYTGLKRFFTEKLPAGRYFDKRLGASVDKGPRTIVKNQAAVVVISLCIAVMMTFGLLRSGWLFHYFGAASGLISIIIILMFSLIGVAMISWAYRFLEVNVGGIIAGIVSGPIIWGLMIYALPILLGGYDYSLFYKIYLTITSIMALFILTMFFIVVGFYRHSRGLEGKGFVRRNP